MSGELKIYDPDLVDVLVGGAPLSGFVEDTFVTIEPDGDDFIEVPGVDGDLTRSKVLCRRATVTFHLMSTSRSNGSLSSLRQGDLDNPGGAGVVSFMVRDRNGVSLCTSSKAWISKAATITYGKQATPREWKMRVFRPIIFEGGT